MVARYPELIAGAEAAKGMGWYPSGGEVYKFDYMPTVEAVDKFRDYIFGGIGFEPADYGLTSQEFRPQYYGNKRPNIDAERLKNYLDVFNASIKKYYNEIITEHPSRLEDWIELVRESYDFGGQVLSATIRRHLLVTLIPSIRFARRAIIIEEMLRQYDVPMPRTIAEIGGGHGRVVRDLLTLMPLETVFYIDLPLNMILAARFLGHFHPGRVHLVWSEADEPKEGHINIVAPWLIDRIDTPIDLLINYLSFQHMSIDALNYYSDRLIRPRVQVIYHENRDRPREEFDLGAADYPFRDAFETLLSRSTGLTVGAQGQSLGVILAELLVRKNAA